MLPGTSQGPTIIWNFPGQRASGTCQATPSPGISRQLTGRREGKRLVKEVATISYGDLTSGDEAIAIIRAQTGAVALALSLREDGDVEIVMSLQVALQLLEALARAAAEASEST